METVVAGHFDLSNNRFLLHLTPHVLQTFENCPKDKNPQNNTNQRQPTGKTICAQGETWIRNVANLRIKETDRISALETELRKLGAQVNSTDADLRIIPPDRVSGAKIATYDDHRIAMSFAVAGLAAPGVVIEDPACVAKTLPEFFALLASLDA